MKQLLVLSLLLLSFSAFAKKIARVEESTGMSFVQKPDGSTVEIRKDFVIQSGDLIFLSENSNMKVIDFFDREFILSEESELLWREEMIELRKGNIWVVSNREESFVITTANAHIVFDQIDSIVSFNGLTERTDISVSGGNANFNNIEIADIQINVGAGQFSFIEEGHQQGIPRTPTILGGDSYLKLSQRFKSKPSQEMIAVNKKPSRGIASVFGKELARENQAAKNKGELIIIKERGRSIASVSKKKYKKHIMNRAPVRFFGVHKLNYQPKPVNHIVHRKIKQTQRRPSSIKKIHPSNNAFEQSLQQHFKQQKRHPAERLELIDELKSVSDDFQKEY